MFDKQTILEYIIHKKRDIAKKLKEFAKQKSNLEVMLIIKMKLETCKHNNR